MIEKMKYINIMGPINDFDRVVERYISKYEIQLEDSGKELSKTYEIRAFPLSNPYAAPMRRAEKVLRLTWQDADDEEIHMTDERALEVIEKACDYYEKRDESAKELEQKREIYIDYMKQLEPFITLDFRIEKLAEFEFVRYRFGRMPYGRFKQFETYLYENKSILYVGGKSDGEYNYGLYFVTRDSKAEADNILNSFQFERIWISYELDGEKLKGTPRQVYNETQEKLMYLEHDIMDLHSAKLSELDIAPGELAAAHKKLSEMYYNYEVRRFATKVKDEFYIFVGWMAEQDAYKLQKEMEEETMVVVTVGDKEMAQTTEPPTRLKNPFFIKPFEFFVKMYGIPSYGEIDPTFFIALTYTIMFGFMFGDFGQGAILFSVGVCLKNKKKMELGGIMAMIGLSSMFFGFMFGSVFGFEEIIHPYWLHPINNINTILIVSVVFGIALNFLAMFLNIYSSTKQRYLGDALLSSNGIAGVVFYASAIGLLIMTLTKSEFSRYIAIIPMAVSVMVIILKEPLAMLLSGQRPVIHGSLVKYFLESVMEFLEVLLSYFTNTISFVRVGAFALGHAGMMSVVMMLSRTINNTYNPVIVVVGNIIVLVLEGLVVGIQVLRLEYYEMFSRFFKGGGREFISYRKKKV